MSYEHDGNFEKVNMFLMNFFAKSLAKNFLQANKIEETLTNVLSSAVLLRLVSYRLLQSFLEKAEIPKGLEKEFHLMADEFVERLIFSEE